MRTIKTITGVLAATGLLLATSSMAAVIKPGVNPDPTGCDFSGSDRNCWEIDPDGNANMPSLEELAGIVDVDPATVTLLYKQNVGGGESGLFADSYRTRFDNSPQDPSDANLVYRGGDAIDCGTCFLWVKDGNHRPYLYIFDISWWNGTESLFLRDFWPRGGSISNIGILGATRPDVQVPAPGPLALLGIAALGIALVRRQRRA